MYQDRRREGQPPSLVRAARILAAAGVVWAHPAQGQVSASVAFSSEYTVRGVSLSAGRPSPQLSVGYDGAHGWYAGAFAARVAMRDSAAKAELIAYGGYAHRMASGLSWEAGASSTFFPHAPDYNYREIYAGLASERLSGRLYLAPAYYGYGGRVAYAELNGFYPLRERIKLIAHAGVLHGLRGPAAAGPDRIDMRIAIGLDAGPCNIQLAWVARSGSGPAPRALALHASYSF